MEEENLTNLLILQPEVLSKFTEFTRVVNHKNVYLQPSYECLTVKLKTEVVKAFCKSCAANGHFYDTLTKYRHQTGSTRNQKSPEIDIKDLGCWKKHFLSVENISPPPSLF